MSKVNEITSGSQLQRMLSANKAVIVDFYATWYVGTSTIDGLGKPEISQYRLSDFAYRCGPCKVISPVFEQLATSHSAPSRLAFAKVDTDRNGDIVSTYGVSA